jgi:hypothetical protein
MRFRHHFRPRFASTIRCAIGAAVVYDDDFARDACRRDGPHDIANGFFFV